MARAKKMVDYVHKIIMHRGNSILLVEQVIFFTSKIIKNIFFFLYNNGYERIILS